MTFIHIGKQVPKKLKDAGWKEKSAIHIGKGVWIITLEKVKSISSKAPRR